MGTVPLGARGNIVRGAVVQDSWYGDNRDLIKWGVLLRLAELFKAERILQLAFNPRDMEFGRLVIGGQEHDIPQEVIAHFRNLRAIGGVTRKVRVTVFDPPFQIEKRVSHLHAARAFLSAFSQERCIVFLDPDTGLERAPKKARRLKYVVWPEAQAIWDKMKPGDVFAFYQHRPRVPGADWFEPRRRQLAEALRVLPQAVKIAIAPSIARDVIISYMERPAIVAVPGEAEAQATVVSVPQPPTVKKEKALKPCGDGCGCMVASKFRPGHDAKYKSMVLKVERGEIKIEELPALMQEQLTWAKTEDGLKCLNPITKVHK